MQTHHHHRGLQRRAIKGFLLLAAIFALVATPIIVFDDLRLDLAHKLGLAPGSGAEKIADSDGRSLLIVTPITDHSPKGATRYRYRADYVIRANDEHLTATDIESEQTFDIPLREVSHVSNDGGGTLILLRGPASDGSGERAVTIERTSNTVTSLPAGTNAPSQPGDWETPSWRKVTGICDRIAPSGRIIGCVNPPDAATYLAGDYQIDAQLYGKFEISAPVYRGKGFVPMFGFAGDDRWIYFQNETGIYRITVPSYILDRQQYATPDAIRP